MSRCFPYPPPGYELKKGVHDLALIESIKKETEIAKKEKKEKKEKKKERKREEKLKKEKSGEDGDVKKKERSRDKKRKLESDKKAGDSLKKTEEETEQLEKSCLSEDHGQNVVIQNLCDSSDSTQNSNKRKKLSSPSDTCRKPGTSIVIRLPLQRNRQPELPNSKEQICSISRVENGLPLQRHRDSELPTSNEKTCSISRTDNVLHLQRQKEPELPTSKEQVCAISRTVNIVPLRRHKDPELLISRELVCPISRTEIVSKAKDEISSRACQQQPCSTSGRTEIPAQDTDITIPKVSRSKSRSQGLDMQYRDLIDNWVPLSMEIDRTDSDDQGWLFEGKQEQSYKEKRSSPSDSNVLRVGAEWPRACYLPAADIYALPYTVPF